MRSSLLLAATMGVEALLLLMSVYLVQGQGTTDVCQKTCEKYRIVDLPYQFSCSDITDEAERLDCQEHCQSCKDICDVASTEKIYNCPDAQGNMEVTPEGPAVTIGDEDISLPANIQVSGGQGRRVTATDSIVERREKEDEATEKEPGAKNSGILIWVALVVILLIVIVGGVVMICVLFVPRRRNRRNPEVESGVVVGHRVTASGSEESVYYPIIPPETQVVLRPSEQY